MHLFIYLKLYYQVCMHFLCRLEAEATAMIVTKMILLGHFKLKQIHTGFYTFGGSIDSASKI